MVQFDKESLLMIVDGILFVRICGIMVVLFDDGGFIFVFLMGVSDKVVWMDGFNQIYGGVIVVFIDMVGIMFVVVKIG